MTKKITISLEDSLVEELAEVAKNTGKKKTQLIREALQDYFDIQAVTKTENIKTKKIDIIENKNR